MTGAIALIVILAKTFLWLVAILCVVYLLAQGHALVLAWRKPVVYEVPPGFYRVGARVQPFRGNLPEGYLVIHGDAYESLLADREHLRQIRDRVDGRPPVPPELQIQRCDEWARPDLVDWDKVRESFGLVCDQAIKHANCEIAGYLHEDIAVVDAALDAAHPLDERGHPILEALGGQ